MIMKRKLWRKRLFCKRRTRIHWHCLRKKHLKKALDDAGIPHIKLGVDQQMRDFGQASTAIQAFADVL